MDVFRIEPQGFAANGYLVTADGVHGVAFDPAQPRMAEEAARRGLSVEYALLTHGHFDHVGGCAALRAAGAQVGCLEAEKSLAEEHNLAREFGGYRNFPPVKVDFTFKNRETLSLCGLEIEVLATPGHTAGSAVYRIGNLLFTGDTLFKDGYGRTDLPTGSSAALAESLSALFALEGNFIVYPGHGEETELDRERR